MINVLELTVKTEHKQLCFLHAANGPTVFKLLGNTMGYYPIGTIDENIQSVSIFFLGNNLSNSSQMQSQKNYGAFGGEHVHGL